MRSRINFVSSQGSLVYVTMPSYFAMICIGLLLVPDGGFGLRPEVKHRKNYHESPTLEEVAGEVDDEAPEEVAVEVDDVVAVEVESKGPEVDAVDDNELVEACILEHNVRYTYQPGGEQEIELYGIVADWRECKAACIASVACVHFTYYYNGECYFSDGGDQEVKEPSAEGTIAGNGAPCKVEHPQMASVEACFVRGVDYRGHDLGDPVVVATANHCRDLCHKDANCKVFSFRTTDDHCWLKRSSGGAVESNSYLSGPSVCKAPVIRMDAQPTLNNKKCGGLGTNPSRVHKVAHSADTPATVRACKDLCAERRDCEYVAVMEEQWCLLCREEPATDTQHHSLTFSKHEVPWVIGGAGDSCDAVCAHSNRMCDADALNALDAISMKSVMLQDQRVPASSRRPPTPRSTLPSNR